MAAGRIPCVTGLKISLTRLRAEFDAFKEASKETRIHLEKETERRLEILNNKTEWVDKQQAEMKTGFLTRAEYNAEHKAVCQRITSLETYRDKALGRNSIISASIAGVTSLLFILINYFLTGAK